MRFHAPSEPIVRRHEAENSHTIFEQLEGDQKRELTLDEFTEFMRTRGIDSNNYCEEGRAATKLVCALFAEMDADGDGSLTMEEINTHLCDRYFVHAAPVIIRTQACQYEVHAASVSDRADSKKAIQAHDADLRGFGAAATSHVVRLLNAEVFCGRDRADPGVTDKIMYLLQQWDVRCVAIVVVRRDDVGGRSGAAHYLSTESRLERFGAALEGAKEALALLFERTTKLVPDQRAVAAQASAKERAAAAAAAERERRSIFAAASFGPASAESLGSPSTSPRAGRGATSSSGGARPLRPAWVTGANSDMRSLRNPVGALKRAVDVVAQLLRIELTAKQSAARQLMHSADLARRMDALPRSPAQLAKLPLSALSALRAELDRPVKFSEGLLGDLRAWLRAVGDAIDANPLASIRSVVVEAPGAEAGRAAVGVPFDGTRGGRGSVYRLSASGAAAASKQASASGVVVGGGLKLELTGAKAARHSRRGDRAAISRVLSNSSKHSGK